MQTSNKKRVAKNTLLLYIRMLTVMCITFFTSRIILESLGVTDFGVYNVVGGIAFSFGFFSSSLSNATQRYLSFAHGQGRIDKVKEYFRLITAIYLLGSGIALVVGGVAGYWIVKGLNIPHHLFGAGLWVYYTTLISLVITLFSSIFDSLVISRENMNFYAYLSIAEAALKLAIAYLIMLSPSDRLVWYALLMLTLTVLVKGSMWIYCRRHFEECDVRPDWDKEKIREIFGFIGWNGLSTVVWVINEQGINVLINLFFGPAVNAARGVANQVNNAVNNFTNNFFLALNPQIIKTYAAGQVKESLKLVNQSSIFSYYLLWIICLPIILRRDYILHLWLKDVPEDTSLLLLWTLIINLINLLPKPQWTLVQAVGNIRNYVLMGCVTMIGCIPIGYFWFKAGGGPQTIFIVMAALRLIYIGLSTWVLKTMLPLSVRAYFAHVFMPVILITGLTYAINSYLNTLIPYTFLGLVSVCIMSVTITGVLGLLLLPKAVRNHLTSIIRTKLSHKQNPT